MTAALTSLGLHDKVAQALTDAARSAAGLPQPTKVHIVRGVPWLFFESLADVHRWINDGLIERIFPADVQLAAGIAHAPARFGVHEFTGLVFWEAAR